MDGRGAGVIGIDCGQLPACCCSRPGAGDFDERDRAACIANDTEPWSHNPRPRRRAAWAVRTERRRRRQRRRRRRGVVHKCALWETLAALSSIHSRLATCRRFLAAAACSVHCPVTGQSRPIDQVERKTFTPPPSPSNICPANSHSLRKSLSRHVSPVPSLSVTRLQRLAYDLTIQSATCRVGDLTCQRADGCRRMRFSGSRCLEADVRWGDDSLVTDRVTDKLCFEV